MNCSNPRYVIITPVRNEEAFLPKTITSVCNQRWRPAEWVIVNDGSSDKTGEIIDRAAKESPWIRAVHRQDRGFRKSGGGVVEAFNDGLGMVRVPDWDYLVKLDGDLEFDTNYFALCLSKFNEEIRLGVGGGTIHSCVGGILRRDTHPRFHVRGATKIYRRACWEEIGGLWPAPGWDTLDELKAAMLGWTSRTFEDARLIQLRATGASDGEWRDSLKNGQANYMSGYDPLFMAAKVLRRALHQPFSCNAWGLAYGYWTGYLRGLKRVDDSALIAFIRRQQRARLWGGPSMWH